MLKPNPCEKCADHCAPCHGNCDKHTEWRSEQVAFKKWINEVEAMNDYLRSRSARARGVQWGQR